MWHTAYADSVLLPPTGGAGGNKKTRIPGLQPPMSYEQRQRVAARAERFGGDLRSVLSRRQHQGYDDDDEDEIDYSSYTIKGERWAVAAADGVAPSVMLFPAVQLCAVQLCAVI